MSFIETRINDNEIVYDTVGGPMYSTDVVVVNSGHEARNVNWAAARGRWQLGERLVRRSELETITRFFRTMKGKAYGFRFRDFADFEAAAAEGRLGTAAIGTGLATYQLIKRYAQAGQYEDRTIRKPVTGKVTVYRNAAPVTFGAGAGQCALDATTGLVTFVADASAAVTGVTPGATTVVALASALSGLAVNGKLYLAGLGGSVAAALNNAAHTINAINGSQYTLAVNTAGLSWTSGGNGYKYPQPTDALTWSGEFDLPVRFDADQLLARFDAYDTASGERLFFLQSLPIVELRQ